jgi:hypothetical protein
MDLLRVGLLEIFVGTHDTSSLQKGYKIFGDLALQEINAKAISRCSIRNEN